MSFPSAVLAYREAKTTRQTEGHGKATRDHKKMTFVGGTPGAAQKVDFAHIKHTRNVLQKFTTLFLKNGSGWKQAPIRIQRAHDRHCEHMFGDGMTYVFKSASQKGSIANYKESLQVRKPEHCQLQRSLSPREMKVAQFIKNRKHHKA